MGVKYQIYNTGVLGLPSRVIASPQYVTSGNIIPVITSSGACTVATAYPSTATMLESSYNIDYTESDALYTAYAMLHDSGRTAIVTNQTGLFSPVHLLEYADPSNKTADQLVSPGSSSNYWYTILQLPSFAGTRITGSVQNSVYVKDMLTGITDIHANPIDADSVKLEAITMDARNDPTFCRMYGVFIKITGGVYPIYEYNYRQFNCYNRTWYNIAMSPTTVAELPPGPMSRASVSVHSTAGDNTDDYIIGLNPNNALTPAVGKIYFAIFNESGSIIRTITIPDNRVYYFVHSAHGIILQSGNIVNVCFLMYTIDVNGLSMPGLLRISMNSDYKDPSTEGGGHGNFIRWINNTIGQATVLYEDLSQVFAPEVVSGTPNQCNASSLTLLKDPAFYTGSRPAVFVGHKAQDSVLGQFPPLG